MDYFDVFNTDHDCMFNNFIGIDRTEFNEWFNENKKEFKVFGDYAGYVPSKSEFIEFEKKYNEIPRTGMCHLNSLRAAKLFPVIKLYVGYVISDMDFEGTTLHTWDVMQHSFNVVDDKVYDFSRLDETGMPTTHPETLKELPLKYIGVEIPQPFIVSYSMTNTQRNEIFVDYYKSLDM